MRDLIIIGGGPGGYVAAIRAAQLGMTVTLVEKDSLGGTCLNRGCIPTKAYYRNARILHNLHESEKFNISVDNITFHMAGARDRKDSIVNNLVAGVARILKAYQVEVIKGEGTLLKEGKVIVNDQEIEAKNILIATGSMPVRLPIEGIELPGVITSEDILELSTVPDRIGIIGGGVIGLEFACIFNEFGSQVNVFEYQPRILNDLDEEISKRMTVYLKKQGINLHTGVCVENISRANEELSVSITGKKRTDTIPVDVVLMAGGRRPCTGGLNLEGIGIALNKNGCIAVNEYFQTNVAGIYAIGDVIGEPMLAHVASEEGIVAVEHMVGQESQVHYHAVPSTIFTIPEVATVGLSEQEANSQGINYKVGRFQFAANGKAMTLGETDGLVKVIADRDNTIIGMHIVGPHASDLILEGVLMVNNRLKIEEVIRAIHPHPTLGEALKEAILDVNAEAIHLVPNQRR
ncbi:dihydrolipoyl dehydrogenase [Syntrophomonas erecta]